MGERERLARYMAAKGQAELARIRDIVERAQRLIDTPGALDAAEMKRLAPPPAYDWERNELFEAGADRSIYSAMVADHATGQGMDLRFHAALARSEAEMRRHVAARIGPHLADQATVLRGAATTPPHDALFVSPALRAMLLRAEDPADRPAILAYAAHLHLNAS